MVWTVDVRTAGPVLNPRSSLTRISCGVEMNDGPWPRVQEVRPIRQFPLFFSGRKKENPMVWSSACEAMIPCSSRINLRALGLRRFLGGSWRTSQRGQGVSNNWYQLVILVMSVF